MNRVSRVLAIVAKDDGLVILSSNAMTKSHFGSKRASLVRLPMSYNLLSPNVAQIDHAIEIKPLVRSSAGGEAFYRFVLVRVDLPR